MSLTFYAGSGSPFAWRVWLALEHKVLPYELRMLSFSSRETRSDAHLARNPRGKVPVLVDDGVTLCESSAIVAYLDEKYPHAPLLPEGLVARARVRRIASEVDTCLFRQIAALSSLTLHRQGPPADGAEVHAAWEGVHAELVHFERDLTGDTFADTLGLADYALFPFLAYLRRVDVRFPAAMPFPPRLAAFHERLEKLPIFQTTWPPHWR